MKRRSVIKTIAILSAGTVFIPGCTTSDTAAIVKLSNIKISGAEENMLAALCDAIIPQTQNFIGATDLKSHEFVLTMIDDCTAPEDQEKFIAGLKAFDKLSHDRFGQIFKSFTREQKTALLAELETKKIPDTEAAGFYQTVKRYTLQSFTTSKQYMVDIKKYNMIPGSRFKGCVKA